MKFRALLLVFLSAIFLRVTTPVYAATSPSLGEADSFVVLAGEAITNVPTSVITGNIGLSPAAGTFYDSGVTTAQVSGTIYAVDASGPAGAAGNNPTLVNQAKTDWTSAYNALSAGDNAACSGEDYGAVTKDLVGLTLVPGVYCANAFTLSGTLTLSGSGVWIFRSAATLVTSGTANVVGGGDACDIWWKVPSSATLGTNTSLKGNILASTSIGMATGASLTGRVLASTGAVTLQSNTIAKPICTTTTSSTTTSSSSTATAPAPCVATEIDTVPIILELKRVSPTSIFISWGPYAGLDTFNVRYGPTNGNWLYNTDVTGFSTTINALPANQPFWFQVAARNICAIGAYGEAKLVGQAGVVNPNVLGVSFPNTGNGPKKNIPWNLILPGSIFTVLAFYSLTRKKDKFLSRH